MSIGKIVRGTSPRAQARRRALGLAIATALAAGLSGGAQAQAFPAVVQLSSLDGSNGFRLDGVAEGDLSGRAVTAAGDVNGDGIDDLLIGAVGADPNGSYSGSSYVVFGRNGGFAPTLALANINGSNGFRLDGVAADDQSSISVSGAGDVNGDGIADLLIGANGADPNGDLSGSSYVVFGRSTGFPATSALSNLNGSDGFRFDGVAADDRFGRAVSVAGDVNDDGIADLLIGADLADPNGSNSGSSYVVFGNSGGFAPTLTPANIDGSNGFRIDGVAAGDFSGLAVSAAGDVNGDGIADLLIGAYRADPNGGLSGSSFVVFGRDTATAGDFAPTLALASLNGSNGFRLDGVAAGDLSGFAVSSAGDINGDGMADLLIGASGADPNGTQSGSSYVVFGRNTGFPATLVLSGLNGNDGFRLDGVAAYDYSGRAVSAAGDVNGDGFDDLLIGADHADPSGSDSGSSYVVFGKNGGFAPILSLANLGDNDGFRLDGVAADDLSGFAVSAAGDVNGDGLADLLIGAPYADPNGFGSGSTYVVFGQDGIFASGFE